MPRIHCACALASGLSLALPAGAARHVQVLRLQPGDALTLFNGEGGEFEATVTQMGRSEVQVAVGTHHAIEREMPQAVHLAVVMPANDRMDWLVEKAAELGAASVQPLVSARSVLRLQGERAAKKAAHWQAVAVAACEQCGRNRVPTVHPVAELAPWLARPPAADAGQRLLLSLRDGARTLRQLAPAGAVTLLNGPEGGLTAEEEDLATAAGFAALTLGPRVLRAETAPLAALAALQG
ncbi:ribosomal RNA small subunit methyltransferase E [Pseudorhodoferax aquiterrae]|uniref:Ribosomal RNA small subunit methyltransferase E n=1 Tax=Pseudorhodoferax aquiterrae TaxID=747304 RepID=A0ABQ3G2K4_9BURK|nr:16S rRNA (uracil(1498)-N(3))-methyltransferase [Pseudorhodoferax aquiterrae]GHC83076.1 ribosomal RNA small subunit methyltransferase E [Pseudorhodoferax aquiterrae]